MRASPAELFSRGVSRSKFMRATRAVIDVGTNSVKLLVAEVEGNTVTPLLEESAQTRLGQGFYETHVLQAEAIQNTAQVVRDFIQTAGRFHPQCVHVFATSAARDAINRDDLIQAIRVTTGLDLIVISGEQEADWAFQGVTTDPLFKNHDLLVMDVGGGSTEFVFGRGDHRTFARSFQIGSVRLLEKFPHSDPPLPAEFESCRDWLHSFVREQVQPAIAEPLQNFRTHGLRLVGTGGTASILARIEFALDSYDRERIEGALISRARLNQHLQHLWSVPLQVRQQIVGLPTKRADVILTGAMVYAVVMQVFGFDTLQVSTRGLRFAAVLNCV